MATPTPAQLATRTRLEAQITRCYTNLKRARFNGNELVMDIAERDLNDLLDQLPPHAAQETP